MPEHTAHIVALSGGADSTAMALALREREPGTRFEYVCTPTGNELPAMEAHLDRIEGLLGAPLVRLRADLGLVAMSVREKCLPSSQRRWCTRKLKLEPFRAHLLRRLSEAGSAVVYVGIRADEGEVRDEGGQLVDAGRGNVYANMEGVEERHPLAEWGWDRACVEGQLAERGVTVPARTDCALCPYQRLGEWWRLWAEEPKLYAHGEALESLISADASARSGEEKTHTLRSGSRDSWPASLAGLRAEFERGRVPTRGKVFVPGHNYALFDDDADGGAGGRCRVCTL